MTCFVAKTFYLFWLGKNKKKLILMTAFRSEWHPITWLISWMEICKSFTTNLFTVINYNEFAWSKRRLKLISTDSKSSSNSNFIFPTQPLKSNTGKVSFCWICIQYTSIYFLIHTELLSKMVNNLAILKLYI